MTLPQFLAHLKTSLDANEFILRDLGGFSAVTGRNTYDSATLNATSSSPRLLFSSHVRQLYVVKQVEASALVFILPPSSSLKSVFLIAAV